MSMAILGGVTPDRTEALVRSVCDSVNRRDLDGRLAAFDPEVEFVPLRSQFAGVYRGHTGLRQFFRDTFEIFEDYGAELLEVRSLGAGRHLIHVSNSMRTRGGDVLSCNPRSRSWRLGRVPSSGGRRSPPRRRRCGP
jgi:hypothetical protein